MKNLPKELENIQNLEEFNVEKAFYVYFLCDKDDLVYIGKTENALDERMKEHNKSKVFSHCYRIRIPTRSLCSKKERELILKFKPKYNIQWLTDNYADLKYRKKHDKINIRIKIDISRLKTEMKIRNLSVPKLAKLSNVLHGSLYYLLSNEKTSLLTLNKLALALHLTPKDLMP